MFTHRTLNDKSINDNFELDLLVNDDFYSHIGTKLLEILKHSDMVNWRLH